MAEKGGNYKRREPETWAWRTCVHPNLGTLGPHCCGRDESQIHGMDISSLIPIVGEMPNSVLLHALGKDSEVLMKQSWEFREALPSEITKIFSFYETMESPTVIKVSTAGKWSVCETNPG